MSNNFSQSLARALGTTTSLESVDVDINIGQDAIVDEDGAVVSPVAPLTDEPIAEAQETQLASDEAEVEDTSDTIDDAENDVETLESIQFQLQRSLDNGGMDTPSFEMMNITMGHIYRKYGIEVSNVMPSLESFEDDRVYQTQVSMEKVKDTLKSVKTNVGEFLKKLWFRIKEFVMNIVKLNFTLEKRVKAIRAAAAGNDMVSKSPKEISLYSAKKLTIGGVLPAREKLMEAAQKAMHSKGIIDKLNDYMDNAGRGLVQLVDNGQKFDKEAFKAAMDKKGGDLAKLTEAMVFQDVKFVNATFGVKGEGKSMLPGLKLVTKKPEKEISNKIMSLPAEDIVTLIDKFILPLNREIQLSKKTKNKDFEKVILELAAESKAKEDTEVKSNKEVARYVKEIMNYQAKTIGYLNGVNKAMVDYCAQSLNVLKNGSVGGEGDDK